MLLGNKPINKSATKINVSNTVDLALNWLKNQNQKKLNWQAINSVESNFSIYSGEAGILLNLIEIVKYSSDDNFNQALTDLSHKLNNLLVNANFSNKIEPYHKQGRHSKNLQLTYHVGYAGVASALLEVYRFNGDKSLLSGIDNFNRALIDFAETKSIGVSWTDRPIVDSGDAGILMYLIRYLELIDDENLLNLAKRSGDYLISQGIVNNDYIKYKVSKNDKNEFPNFSFGSSGTGLALAKLSNLTNEDKYLRVSKKVAAYLKALFVKIGDKGALIPYELSTSQQIYYLGYCHGPVGSVRIFETLYQITGEQRYLEDALTLAQGIMNANAPFQHSAGYWHFYGKCCGTAGFLDMFLDLYRLSHKSKLLEYAQDCADKLLSEAIIDKNKEQVFWTQAWGRQDYTNYNTFIGSYDGMLGIISSLIYYFSVNTDSIIKINEPIDSVI